MAVTWTTVRDSLATASTTALASDKAAALALRDRINALGAAYDAAVAAGAFQPASGATVASVTGAQRSTAWGAALRAVQRAEEFIPGAQQVFAPTDPFTFAGTSVTPAVAGLYLTRAGEVSTAYAEVRIQARFAGEAGNQVSARYTLTGGPDGSRGLEEYFNGRLVRTVGFSRGENYQVKAFGHFVTATAQQLPTADMASPRALTGGAGDDPAALAYRATLATARVNGVISASTTPAATASAARTTLARLTTLLNELQTAFSGGNAPAYSAAPATVPTALELQLAAALDEAAALLSYLS